ncbi:MAG: arginine--tRNA ligase, partial [Solirubrobacteraceae bacterium]
KREGQGDYSTNAAMLLAPVLGAPPREIAQRLAVELHTTLGDWLARTEVAGPGFLNLVLSDGWHRAALATMLGAGDRFGAGGARDAGAGETSGPTGAGGGAERILVEFVSANPTGPLVAASGRHAAYGDALARILEHHGHTVAREYYFNDAGNQIRLLGESVRARARDEPVPEGGYQGEYVAELARELGPAVEGGVEAGGGPDAADDLEELTARAVELLLGRIKATLTRYGVQFDSFFSEQTLHAGSPSRLDLALAALSRAGHLYKSEGAVWLRTTSFGDAKDRVVVRSSGEPTYLAADLAYMLDKRARGFGRQLNPMGSDHHAYVRELKAAMAALGGDPDTIEVPILQFVHLVEGGKVFAMSKRRGDFVTLDELLDEIGVDAARFFMLQRSHDRTLELDLELARQQSAENPVYYVQYAHARIASMLGRFSDGRVAAALEPGGGSGGSEGSLGASGGDGSGDSEGLFGGDGAGALAGWGEAELHVSERDLIKKLAAFPGEIAEAAGRRAPHRIAVYALELAQCFTAFYRDCRVVGACPEAVESFRIALSVAAGRTIALALRLLGVSAPESM